MTTLDRRAAVVGAAAATIGAAKPFHAATADDRLARALDEVAVTLAPPPSGSPWKIADETTAGAARRFDAPGQALSKLARFDPAGLRNRARLELDSVQGGLEREAALGAFPFGAGPGRPFVIDSRSGSHLLVRNGLPGPAPEGAALDAYLDACGRVALNLDGETERLTRDAAEWRVVLPRPYLAELEGRLRRLANQPVSDCTLVLATPEASRMAVEVFVEAKVRPALARQAEALARLLARAPESGGARAWRDGERYHALALRAGLGLDLAPPAVEAAAREEISRLSADIEALLREEGLREGSVGERLRRLMAEPSALYPDTASGRERAVADMNAVLRRAEAHLSALHPAPPPGPFAIRRMDPADEAKERPGYRTPTATGGAYVVDLHAIRRRPAWTLPTVACHETLPGHLLQLPLQAAANPHPLRLRFAAGYFEGWGVYAEGLGDGLGLYNRRARIGYLQSMLFRLSRAVADIGVHHHGWTPDRARAELAALYGGPLFNGLDVEVERLFLAPGAGGADAFGRLKLLRLRQAWPGDLASFHAAVLDHGPYPLRLLERAVALQWPRSA